MAQANRATPSSTTLSLADKQAALARLGIGNNTSSRGFIAGANAFAGKQASRVVIGFEFAKDAYEEESMRQRQMLERQRQERTERMYQQAVAAGLIEA